MRYNRAGRIAWTGGRMKQVAVFALIAAAVALAGCEPVVVHRSPYSVAVEAKSGDSAMARRRALEHCLQYERTPTFVRETCSGAVCLDKVHYFVCE